MPPEDVPVGDIVVGVREADCALLTNGAGLAERQDVRVAPAAGHVGAAAVDDTLIVHSYVTPRNRDMLHLIILPQNSLQRV